MDSLDEMYRQALLKAADDPGFRAALLAAPKAAVESLFDVAIPAHVTLQAVAQPADTYVIVVPVPTAVATDGELADDDLEAVAGGAKAGGDQPKPRPYEGYWKLLEDKKELSDGSRTRP